MKELREHVAKVIGKIARPQSIVFTDDLPKTRLGKIMRRLLRDVAEGRELGDVTTLQNAPILEEIKTKADSMRSEEGVGKTETRRSRGGNASRREVEVRSKTCKRRSGDGSSRSSWGRWSSLPWGPARQPF